MNGSRIRGKMRGQIVRFSGEVSGGLCKTARRFVCEVLYGITASESVMLSEIGRTLDEEIRLKKTETRLSSQLGREKLKECVERNLLSLGASRIGRDTLLIVDISDIAKPYACRMEYLAEVRDGSVGQIGVGYWTVQVVGAEVEGVHITPLVHRLYSQNAPGFVSENEEILGAVRDICQRRFNFPQKWRSKSDPPGFDLIGDQPSEDRASCLGGLPRGRAAFLS
jgi:hypothetical protein